MNAWMMSIFLTRNLQKPCYQQQPTFTPRQFYFIECLSQLSKVSKEKCRLDVSSTEETREQNMP